MEYETETFLEVMLYMFLVIGVCLMGIAIIYNIIKMDRYKKCYDNNFKYNYCEKYKNY